MKSVGLVLLTTVAFAAVAASLPLGRKPELTEVDGKGHAWVNLEDKAEIVCANKLVVVSDPAKGKVITSAPIGGGTDGVAYDDGYLFSANGTDGTITMVEETSPGKYEALATIPTMPSARTIAGDPQAQKLYLPAAEPSPPAAGKAKAGRRWFLTAFISL